MNNKNILISLSDIPSRKEAPTLVKLFSWGLNKTTKGDFILSEKSANEIIEAWKEYGNKLNIDYNHAQLFSVNPDESISAGTFDLELRETGLFAVNIVWTDKAKSLVEAKEYIYISPAFLTNEEGEVVELINFALTNIPATKNMDQLIAAFKLENKTMDEQTPVEETEKLAEEMPVEEKPFDCQMAIGELKAELESLKLMIQEMKPEEKEEEVVEEVPVEETVVEDETLSTLSDLKKENMILLGIIGKKILPSETDKLKTLSIVDLEKELGSRKEINLTNVKQYVDTSKALSVDKSVDEAFRETIKRQLKL
jgi:hypothetical protein